MLTVHGTTACFPGFTVRAALARLREGASEPQLGALSTAHVQVCPQNFGRIDEAEAEALRAEFPEMRLRCHANARVLERHVMFDASTVSDDTLPYFHALADRCRRFGASVMSIHAGYEQNATHAQMVDNVRRLQGEVFGDVQLAVEGLYPNAHRPQLLATWADYERALRTSVPIAVDLSHLNIVAHHDGAMQTDLVRELLASPTTLEVHLSDNTGTKDAHDVLARAPWWWPLLDAIGPHAIAFSEGNQTRSRPRSPAAH
jgi:hypothetical protein